MAFMTQRDRGLHLPVSALNALWRSSPSHWKTFPLTLTSTSMHAMHSTPPTFRFLPSSALMRMPMQSPSRVHVPACVRLYSSKESSHSARWANCLNDTVLNTSFALLGSAVASMIIFRTTYHIIDYYISIVCVCVCNMRLHMCVCVCVCVCVCLCVQVALTHA